MAGQVTSLSHAKRIEYGDPSSLRVQVQYCQYKESVADPDDVQMFCFYLKVQENRVHASSC